MSDRPIPVPLPRIRAFERRGFGLFLHWGLYSQRACGEWTWRHHQVPRDEYVALQRGFTARSFDARAIVQLAKEAGCRYVCLTTRHHEGFSLYDTRGLNTYDAPHSPAGRDLVAEFSAACDEAGMGKFFYHTTLDWWHPDFDAPGRWQHYLDYLNQSVSILCQHYGRVDGLWFDGNWARRDRDWREGDLYALIRRHQSECIIVNNSSTGALGAEGGHAEIDVRTYEQGRPGVYDRRGKPKWLATEMCETINSHWGISEKDFSHKSPAEIIDRLVACRARGANLLLNVGPDAEGGIGAYEAALLRLVGRWVAGCPQAIYDVEPSPLEVRGGDAIVKAGKDHFYFCGKLEITNNGHLHHGEGAGLRTIDGRMEPVKRITWCDTGEVLEFTQDRDRGLLTFRATAYPYGAQRVWRIARIEG